MLELSRAYQKELRIATVESKRKYACRMWALGSLLMLVVVVCCIQDTIVVSVASSLLVLVFVLSSTSGMDRELSQLPEVRQRNSDRLFRGLKPEKDNRVPSTVNSIQYGDRKILDSMVTSTLVPTTTAHDDGSTNFDVLSPQRISRTVWSESTGRMEGANSMISGPLHQKDRIGYELGGSNNVSNLHSTYESLKSITSVKQESSSPIWHKYHTSPTRATLPISPQVHTSLRKNKGIGGRTSTSSLAASNASDNGLAGNEDMHEMLRRVSAEMKGVYPSFKTALAGRGSSSTDSRGNANLSPSSTLFGTMNQNQLEHALEKLLTDTTSEVLAIMHRSSAARLSTHLAPVSLGGWILSPDEAHKVKLLLNLKVERQVLRNNFSVDRSDILRYCREVGVNEDLLRRYESTAATLCNAGALVGSKSSMTRSGNLPGSPSPNSRRSRLY